MIKSELEGLDSPNPRPRTKATINIEKMTQNRAIPCPTMTYCRQNSVGGSSLVWERRAGTLTLKTSPMPLHCAK